MLSRLFWVGIAGIAIITGIVIQDGGEMFSWGREAAMDAKLDASISRTVDRAVDRAVDGNIDRMQIISDGREIDVPPETKRAMADAVARLVRAQADIAILKVSDAGAEEVQAATVRRDQARSDVDRLKAQIEGQEAAARAEQGALSQQIERDVRDEVREQVREEVREAVRN